MLPSDDTSIGWTDLTWNPIHGCFKVDPACANCYAAKQSQMWGHTENPWTVDNVQDNLRVQSHHLSFPVSKGPSRIFVNSMSDLFLPKEVDGEPLLTDDYLHEIFDVMDEADQHVYQVLTKHGTEHDERLRSWDRWPENLWMGVSVGTEGSMYRIDHLKDTDASIKWVSFEPLVESTGVTPDDLRGIDWVVIGGESGSASTRRGMDHAWAREVRDAAREVGIPVFFKQSSGRHSEEGRELAERGSSLSEAREKGYETTTIREFPSLPDQILEAKPELEHSVVSS
jgi:protein gp37